MTKSDKKKLVDYILGLPQDKQWKAAQSLWLKVNPISKLEDGTPIDAKTEDKLIRLECAQLREHSKVSGNKFMTSDNKNSDLRLGLRFPSSLMTYLDLIDPTIFQGDLPQQRKNWVKLAKVFPMYRTSEAL